MPGPVVDPRAARLLERYGARFGGPDLPVPVEAIAEDLLGLAVALDDHLQVAGMLLPARREIWLNGAEAAASPGRRRFTLAHELGHWICHCGDGAAAPVLCRSEDVALGTGRELEREANVFAAELLMPREAVATAFAREGSAVALGARFGVSTLALQWRLYNLGLAAERPVSA